MKLRKYLFIFFIFMLFTSKSVLAVDNSDKCPDKENIIGSKTPYEIEFKNSKGSSYGKIKFQNLFTRGLEFQKDSFKIKLFTKIGNKNYNILDLIPEYNNFIKLGKLDSDESGFTYELNENQCSLLSRIDNDIDLILNYEAKITEDALVYYPDGSCGLSYSSRPSRDSVPIPTSFKDSEIITVIWDDDNDRDGIRTKQEVYYLKLDPKSGDNPAFKILEIPARGKNKEEHVFGNIPYSWGNYFLDGRNLDEYEKIVDGLKITYKHIPEKIDFNVNVVWEDENNKFNTRPDELNFSINPKEKDNTYAIKSSQSWEKSFKEFKYEEGQEISYNLNFPDIDKYEKSVVKNGNDYTVSYKSKLIEVGKIDPIAKKDIIASKTWIGGPESDHKQVELNLYRKTKSVGEELISKNYQVKEENGKFIYTWKDMPVTNSKGEVYEYSVKELEIPENYELSQDGLNLVNTYKSPIADVKVDVKWIGGEAQKTKIILYRKNSNTELEEVGIFDSDKNNLLKVFENLPITDKDGVAYIYYAHEEKVPEGFTVSYSEDKLTVINTKIPEENPKEKEESENNIRVSPSRNSSRSILRGIPEKEDSLKYIFTINEFDYKEIRNNSERTYRMDVAPVIRNDRTMLPIRYVAEALDAEVIWNEETRVASFIKNGLKADIQIDGDEIVLSNGKTIKMDSKALNINSRILLPITNVANVFGLTNGDSKDNIKQDIEWDEDSRTVTIYVK